MKKKKTGKKKVEDFPQKKEELTEMSVGSSNAFEATETPEKDKEKEWSDEEIDEMIDEEDDEK